VAMFIVERGLSATTTEMVMEGQRRLCEAARRASDDRHEVTYLRSLVVPGRKVCFDLFEAATTEVVQAVNDVAQVPFRRIDLVHERVAGGPDCHAGGDEPTIPSGPRPGSDTEHAGTEHADAEHAEHTDHADTEHKEEDTWTPPSTDGHDAACGCCPSTAC